MVSYSVAFSILVFVSWRSGLHVYIRCIEGGRCCVVFFGSFWLSQSAVAKALQRLSAGDVFSSHFYRELV